jgi:hypothetical protein
MLDFYSTDEANSFKVFDKVVEMYGVVTAADENCHIKDYMMAIQSKLYDNSF